MVVPLAGLLIFAGADIFALPAGGGRRFAPALGPGRRPSAEAIVGPATSIVEMIGHRALPLLNSLIGAALWVGARAAAGARGSARWEWRSPPRPRSSRSRLPPPSSSGSATASPRSTASSSGPRRRPRRGRADGSGRAFPRRPRPLRGGAGALGGDELVRPPPRPHPRPTVGRWAALRAGCAWPERAGARHCERSKAIQHCVGAKLDCFVPRAPRNDEKVFFARSPRLVGHIRASKPPYCHFMTRPHIGPRTPVRGSCALWF